MTDFTRARSGGAMIPESFAADMVVKLFATFPFSEETWVDAGHEPPPGYWRRQEARQVAMGSLRAIVRLRWYGLVGPVQWRLAHAWRALRGIECEP